MQVEQSAAEAAAAGARPSRRSTGFPLRPPPGGTGRSRPACGPPSRDARRRVAFGQQPLELGLAPAPAERRGMERRECRGVAAAAASDSVGSARRQQAGDECDHRRASRARVLRAARRGPADTGAWAGRWSAMAAAPRRATQSISGRAGGVDQRWRRIALRPSRRDEIGPGADDAGRAGAGGAHSVAHGRDARLDDGAAAGAEQLHVDLIVARIDHRRSAATRRWRRRVAPRRRRACVRPTAGFPAASAKPRAAETPTRRPVKLPGPTVTAIRSRSREFDSRLAHHPGDQRHQGFGMAAHHRQRLAREQPRDRCRARRRRRPRARYRWQGHA